MVLVMMAMVVEGSGANDVGDDTDTLVNEAPGRSVADGVTGGAMPDIVAFVSGDVVVPLCFGAVVAGVMLVLRVACVAGAEAGDGFGVGFGVD